MLINRKLNRYVGLLYSLFIYLIFFVSPVFAAANWTFTSPTKSTALDGSAFHIETMSSDGKYMYASGHYQGIYRSTDYGQTWGDPAPSMNSQDFAPITTSSDGKYVYMAGYSGDVWFSSDYAVNWVNRTNGVYTGNKWVAIDTTANGQVSIVGTETEGVFISNDYGVTYTATTLPTDQYFYGVGVSADGSFMFASQYGGQVFASTDGGVNWDPLPIASGGYFEGSLSSTGKYLALVAPNDGIYVSSDFGQNWTKRPGTSAPTWYDIEISSTGQYMAAVDNGGDIWISSDYGETWDNQTTGTEFSGLNYPYVAISGDGKYVLSNVVDDNLYLGYNPNASKVLLASTTQQNPTVDTLAETGSNLTKANAMYSLILLGSILILIRIQKKKCIN